MKTIFLAWNTSIRKQQEGWRAMVRPDKGSHVSVPSEEATLATAEATGKLPEVEWQHETGKADHEVVKQ